MTKTGEIVFDEEGNFVEINGNIPDRRAFEFVELSEYYKAIDHLQIRLNEIGERVKEAEEIIKTLI